MTIFSVENHHSAGCGEPDAELTIERDRRAVVRTYYENEHGEQWMGVFQISDDKPYIVGGDSGWGDKYYLDMPKGKHNSVHNLILTKGEKLWLEAFMHTVMRVRAYRQSSWKNRKDGDHEGS